MCSRILLLLCVFSWLNVARAQSIITAENIEELQSVRQIDFDDLPEAAGEISNGQFFTNSDGSLLAVVNRQGQIVILDDDDQLQIVTDVISAEDGFPATFINGAFEEDRFVGVHTIGNGYIVTLINRGGADDVLRVTSDDKPVSVWLAQEAVWLEMIPDEPNQPPYLVRWIDGEQTIMSFAPAQVANTVVRIGRLAPPLAVTVTDDHKVQRWDLETGELTGQMITGEIPIYGHMLPDSDQMVWRDPASTALRMLNFATGEDVLVAPLNGSYVPFLFMNAQADVILGVHVDDEPVVTAWLVESGERLPLGLYRQCNRPPDMVRLSADTTTLIVGCDTGLNIWRNQG